MPYAVITALVFLLLPVKTSTPASPATVGQSTLRYGQRPEQFMTVYTPTSGSRHPAVLFVHGGAWRRSWPLSSELTFGRNLAIRTGWVVAVTGYNATSTPGWRVQPRNIALALEALRADPQVRPHRVALWGESAGGHLALLTAYRHPDYVRAVVSVSGPTGMRYEYRHARAWLRSDIRWFERGTPSARPRHYTVTSPTRQVRTGLPPTLLATSRHDPIVAPGQQRLLCDALHAVGVVCRLAEVAGNDHSSEIETETVIGTTRTVRGTAIGFLSKRLDG